jgi:signal transduction histidine kinase
MAASEGNTIIWQDKNLLIIDSLKHLINTQPLTEKQQMEFFAQIACQYHAFKSDSSFVYRKKCITIAEKLNEYELLMGYYIDLGVLYTFKGVYDTAQLYFDQSLQLAIKHKNKFMEAESLSFIAFGYAKEGKYNMAIDNYIKSLKIFESSETEFGYYCARNLSNLGEIHRRLGNIETALQYLKQAEEKCNQFKKISDVYNWRIPQVFNEYAYNYISKGDYETALHYALKADSITFDYNIVNRCYTKSILATIYLHKKEYDLALRYAKESFHQADVLEDVNLYSNAGKILSDVYLAQKRYRDAETEALKVWQLDSTNIDESRPILQNLALANIYMGNEEKAAYYLKKYSEMNEKYSEKSFHNTVSDLGLLYETEKKELKITALEKDKKFYSVIIFAGGAILLLTIGLLLIRQRNINQKRKLLEQQQQLIATQAVLDGETAERSRLARDLHDGLGGMLSVVKLNLKEMKNYAIMDGDDVNRFGKALEMLDESIGELRRVAHHIMPDSLMRYGLKVSLEDFCRAIPGAQFQYLGENPRLDSSLEVLLYRCAYELVNNAVKHANATEINVQLMLDNGVTSLTVHDNGIGFDPQKIKTGGSTDSTGSPTAGSPTGVGLENIRNRLAVFNGKMFIHSSPETGTEISIEIEPS